MVSGRVRRHRTIVPDDWTKRGGVRRHRGTGRTAGDDGVRIFDTPGCRTASRADSRRSWLRSNLPGREQNPAPPTRWGRCRPRDTERLSRRGGRALSSGWRPGATLRTPRARPLSPPPADGFPAGNRPSSHGREVRSAARETKGSAPAFGRTTHSGSKGHIGVTPANRWGQSSPGSARVVRAVRPKSAVFEAAAFLMRLNQSTARVRRPPESVDRPVPTTNQKH